MPVTDGADSSSTTAYRPAKVRITLQAGSGLAPAEAELVTLAALIALDAPEESFDVHVARALGLGVEPGRIWGVLEALAVIVGVPRLVGAVSPVAAALAAHAKPEASGRNEGGEAADG